MATAWPASLSVPPSHVHTQSGPTSSGFQAPWGGGTKLVQSAHIGSPESPCHTQPLTIASPPPTTRPLTRVSNTSHVDAQSRPTGPLLTGEETGGHLSSLFSVVGEGAAPASCTPPPHLPLLCSPRGWFGASPPRAGSLAEEGRLVPGIWPWAGEGAWISQDQRPQAGREPVLRPLVSCAPPALSEGLTLPPRTQVSKVPVRVGPAARALCTLSPWPRQAHLSSALGSPLGLPRGHLARLLGQTPWRLWLQLEAAHQTLPGQGPRAGGGRGATGPQPAATCFTLVSEATSVAVLSVGSEISLGEGAVSRGAWSPKVWSAQ